MSFDYYYYPLNLIIFVLSFHSSYEWTGPIQRRGVLKGIGARSIPERSLRYPRSLELERLDRMQFANENCI